MKLKAFFHERINKLREEILIPGKAKGLLISRSDNFSWLTFGARNHITLNTVEGVASLLITEDSVILLTDNIEKERLKSEEFYSDIWDELEIIEYNWWEGEEKLLSQLSIASAKELISDTGRYDTLNLNSRIAPFRYTLVEPEIETYRQLGKDCDEIFWELMPKLSPENTELEVQGMFYEALAKKGIEPLLTIVFGEDSSTRYRHNLSRNISIGKRVFVSICARKHGLVVSSTRSALFDVNAEITEQHRKNCYVDAVAIVNSLPGKRLSQIFLEIKRAYEAAGYDGEWKLHHQGGLAGYNPRELVASDFVDHILAKGNAVAWNPTITGTKSEDTVIVGEVPEIISFPQNSHWPAVELRVNDLTIRRPDIIVL
ncbi:hypothetical protein AT15_05240 [Kosmotoga arenicorallina S304]|uniref:Peptidase M24 domain-containing protein n=1 Tax=Kosmotoga arenicorallina S304 TaxID=1453497 RepID=A0A176JUV6_9BACT|nr:hypothetical protein AT15_05240 [Kosmotoga arenicorallina S304]